ncbi:NAP1-related protein 2-like isoform X2 [Euphorbia lathyris]|uniref:NAP1-related protein 2-like isoform X2 n=1 Tax=Euphorbia lathyris TaxID=212925 RepID=UPI003314478E
MVAENGKKFKVLEEEDSDSIDAQLILSVEKLQDVQDEIEKINGEFCDKVLEMDQQYNGIRKPVYVKRNEIIKTIPDFWLTAFLSHPDLCDLLTEEDQKIFKYLDSLNLEDLKDVKSGYSITFNFKENPHFEDTKLMKSFTLSDEGTIKITGTNIKWKEGTGAANGAMERKKGSKRPWRESSFFGWFGEGVQNRVPVLGDDIADIIKEELWPNPLKYFNNNGTDEEDSGEDEEEDVASDEEDDADDQQDSSDRDS